MKRTTKIVNGVIALAVVGAGLAAYATVGAPSSNTRTTSTDVTVRLGNVQSSVSATGNVTTDDQLNVNFAQSGVLTEIDVAVGQNVAKGAVLGKVDAAALQAGLTTANANYQSALAKQVALKAGPTALTKQQDQISIQQSQLSLDGAQAALDNATATQASNLVNYDQAIAKAQANLDTAKATVAALTADKAACDGGGTPTSAGVTCANVNDKLNAANTSLSQAQTALNTANSAKAAGVQKDQQSVDSATRQLRSAQLSYDNTVANVKSKEAPAAAADLAAAEAAVVTAKASLDTAQKNVDNATLVAPNAGLIGSVNYKVGATVPGSSASTGSGGSGSSTSTPFVVMTGVTARTVRAGFSEADAAKVKVGQAATVALDALPNTSLTGKVTLIDSTSTVVSNVVTYNVTVELQNATADVKPGMTASVTAVIDSRQNVLVLSTGAVSARGNTAVLQVRKGTTVTPATVNIGLRGDSNVEITSGLSAGDVVVVRRTTVGSATNQTQTSAPGGAFGGGGIGAGAGAGDGGAGGGH